LLTLNESIFVEKIGDEEDYGDPKQGKLLKNLFGNYQMDLKNNNSFDGKDKKEPGLRTEDNETYALNFLKALTSKVPQLAKLHHVRLMKFIFDKILTDNQSASVIKAGFDIVKNILAIIRDVEIDPQKFSMVLSASLKVIMDKF
jgi:hypothetical protein